MEDGEKRKIITKTEKLEALELIDKYKTKLSRV